MGITMNLTEHLLYRLFNFPSNLPQIYDLKSHPRVEGWDYEEAIQCLTNNPNPPTTKSKLRARDLTPENRLLYLILPVQPHAQRRTLWRCHHHGRLCDGSPKAGDSFQSFSHHSPPYARTALSQDTVSTIWDVLQPHLQDFQSSSTVNDWGSSQ